MLLRRITKHVTDQNWFAVFIDFLIVVVGILIALQFTNWNEERQDRHDESEFLSQLHDEIKTAEGTSTVWANYRKGVLQDLDDVLDVLFARVDRSDLTEGECASLMASRATNFIIREIGYFNELSASGRIGIIQNKDLRLSLVRLQQTINSSNRMMQQLSPTLINLEVSYPHLIKSVGYFSNGPISINGRSDAGSIYTCNTMAMKDDNSFLNSVSNNVDMYDAFVRDVVEPWQQSIVNVHKELDSELGVIHRANE